MKDKTTNIARAAGYKGYNVTIELTPSELVTLERMAHERDVSLSSMAGELFRSGLVARLMVEAIGQ